MPRSSRSASSPVAHAGHRSVHLLLLATVSPAPFQTLLSLLSLSLFLACASTRYLSIFRGERKKTRPLLHLPRCYVFPSRRRNGGRNNRPVDRETNFAKGSKARDTKAERSFRISNGTRIAVREHLARQVPSRVHTRARLDTEEAGVRPIGYRVR